MPQDDLINYIKKEVDLGVKLPEIKSILLSKGWKVEDIDNVLNQIYPPPSPQPNSEIIPPIPPASPSELEQNFQKNNFPFKNLKIDFKNPNPVIFGFFLVLFGLVIIIVLIILYFQSNNTDYIFQKALSNTLKLKNIEFEVNGDYKSPIDYYFFDDSNVVKSLDFKSNWKVSNFSKLDGTVLYGKIDFSRTDSPLFTNFSQELFINKNNSYYKMPIRYQLAIPDGVDTFYIIFSDPTNHKTINLLENSWIKTENDEGLKKDSLDLQSYIKEIEYSFLENKNENNLHYYVYSYKIPKSVFKELFSDSPNSFTRKYSGFNFLTNQLLVNNLPSYFGEGTVWISKKDLLVSKIIPNKYTYIAKRDVCCGNTYLSFELLLKDYNKELNLEAPLNFIELDAFDSLLNRLYNDEYEYNDPKMKDPVTGDKISPYPIF